MKQKLVILLSFVFVYLQYSLWLGKNNLLDYLETRQVIVKLQLDNGALKLRNDRLFAETANLYNGLEAIEERARTCLGMIKPNEHFYRLIIDLEQNK